jgi:hypothetical protein
MVIGRLLAEQPVSPGSRRRPIGDRRTRKLDGGSPYSRALIRVFPRSSSRLAGYRDAHRRSLQVDFVQTATDLRHLRRQSSQRNPQRTERKAGPSPRGGVSGASCMRWAGRSVHDQLAKSFLQTYGI